jgi:hypothetical protein
VKLLDPTTSDIVVAHGNFLDTLPVGRLRHADQPKVIDAVRAGTQRPMSGAVGWARRWRGSRRITAAGGDVGVLRVDVSAAGVGAANRPGRNDDGGRERRSKAHRRKRTNKEAAVIGQVGHHWRLI